MQKPWKVILAFTGIFLAGVLGGTLLGARYSRQILPQPTRPSWGQNFGPQMMKRFTERLELTTEQKARMEPIIQKAQSEVQALRRTHVREVTRTMDQMHSEISAMLTPEQRVKLEELRKRFLERSERIRRENQNRGNDRPRK